ncbi:hypothetical protein [Streptomyces sp. WAC08241]|uniref:hypothetical protein n=1 Tax=Streptomyces sp. WAC08241 TaxID=2487421 RepID=UPI00163D3696|nr:hypothetical protein [Streptomyces sp. WAC08241]
MTDQSGTDDRHGTTGRYESTGRHETSEQRETSDRHGATGPDETYDRRVTSDRREIDEQRVAGEQSPVPAERSTATAEKSALPGQTGVRPAPLAKATGRGDDEHLPDLLGKADGDAYRERWREVQGRFVDDPREAVHSADELVADVMRTLAEAFADHKRTLEGQWSEGRDADTEDLRVALREYRSFFNRLLTTTASPQ